MKCILKVWYMIVCTIILFVDECQARSEFFVIADMQNWQIIKEVDGTKKMCHAVTYPYMRETFYGEIAGSTFVISYRAPKSYSVSFTTKSRLEKKNAIVIVIQDNTYLLKTNKLPYSATTYSADQDVDVINDLIREDSQFKIEARGKDDALEFLYFSSVGIKKVLLYMEKRCGGFVGN